MVNVLSFANGTLYHQKGRIPSGFVVLHQLEADGSSLLLKGEVGVAVDLVACQRFHQPPPLRRSPEKADDVVQFAKMSRAN
jgi:hypothetical protein